MKFKVKKISAQQILNSKGIPTVEVSLETDFGVFVDSCPSGTSKGDHEAWEVRDENGGVSKAIENVEKIIAPQLLENEFGNQKEVDEKLIQLDGTKNKSNLGVNAILPVSMVFCRAQAKAESKPLFRHINDLWRDMNPNGNKDVSLPAPCFNILNGGLHSKGGIDFQEFMAVPLADDSQRQKKDFFRESLERGKKIYEELKRVTQKKYGDFETGTEGGVAPLLKTPPEALNLILESAKNVSCEKELAIFLDIASSSFYKNGIYKTKMGDFSAEDLIDYYLNLLSEYPIGSIEDPFAEDDWSAWTEFKSKIKNEKLKINIVGDDLLATNPKRIKEAQERGACDTLLLKLNQIGTVSEGLEAAFLARKDDWKIMVSHRSGETQDDFIADLAAGIGADFIKSGAPGPKERMAKYNRLAKIEEELK